MERKMMPGQEPYTDEEWSRVRALISDACEAQDHCTADELEDAAREHAERAKANP